MVCLRTCGDIVRTLRGKDLSSPVLCVAGNDLCESGENSMWIGPGDVCRSSEFGVLGCWLSNCGGGADVCVVGVLWSPDRGIWVVGVLWSPDLGVEAIGLLS